MAYWEFLLQKEGDRDWLPLETAHVEISEGRYRIIAHTSYCNAPVAIRLSQVLADTVPPQRKTLQRSGKTNQDGLMVVIPFTHLTPGSWTITCSEIAAKSSPPSHPWKYGVQLQVLAIESGVEYWDTDFESGEESEQPDDRPQPPTERSIPSPEPVIRAPAPEATTVPTDSEHTVPDQTVAMPSEALFDGVPPEDLPLRLQLQHQALVARSDSPVVLQGQVTTFSQVEGLSGGGTLWIQLRDPETGTIVHQAARSLAMSALPSRFDLPLQMPEGMTSRLLVGELSLWTPTDPPQILAIQGFTVTLNLDALLETVANQGERAADGAFDSAVSDEASPRGDSVEDSPTAKLQSPLSPREIPFRLIYLPATGLTLPPVVYRPIDQKPVGSPSLPSFTGQPSRSPVEPTSASSSPAKPLSLPLVEEAPNRQPPSPNRTDPQKSSPEITLPSFGRSRQADSSPPESSTPVDAAPSAKTSMPVFQPDFKGRFWERLSALAEEAQKAAADAKARMEAAGIDVPSPSPGVPTVPPQEPSTEVSSSANHEVVVYEFDDSGVVEGLEVSRNAVTEVPQVEVLRPDEPDIEDLGDIPLPELMLPGGDLVAGSPLPISIRLPLYPRRLAVKVWVTDLQSRTLVDRPRWLMNWTPNDEGQQTTFLQLQVPKGSMEVRFEAIAIDLATQRESYKTTLVRSVIPPDLAAEESSRPS